MMLRINEAPSKADHTLLRYPPGISIASAILISILLGSSVLYYSTHYGLLSGLLQYDDCGIILNGLINLKVLTHSYSFFRLFINIIHLDIHSPLSDFQVIIGLLISNGNILFPFILSLFWLAVALTAIFWTLDRHRWPLAAAVAIFICTQPLTVNSLAFIKSDWRGGLLMCAAVVLFEKGCSDDDRIIRRLGAALLGIAILSKLTAFYLPVLSLFIICIFHIYSKGLSAYRSSFTSSISTLYKNPTERENIIECMIAAGPFLLLFTWKARGLINYIGQATGGVWLDGSSVTSRIFFYGPFSKDSWLVWGSGALCLALFLAVAVATSMRSKRFYSLGAIAIALLTGILFFVPLIAAGVSDHSFSATAIGVLMAASIMSMKSIDETAPRWGGYFVLFGTIAITAFTRIPLTDSAYYSAYSSNSNELRALSYTDEKIVSAMVRDAPHDDPTVAAFYDQVFAPVANIGIRYFEKTGQLPKLERVDDLSAVGVKDELRQADFALTIVPSDKAGAKAELNLFAKWPISRAPEEADKLVLQSGRFLPDGTYKVRGGEIHLYRVAGK